MPDDYRISDLSTAPSIGNSDLMELSVVNTASETGYTSMKAPVLNLANKIVNATQYVSDLQTQNKTITGAINEIAQGGGGGGGDADIVKTASGNPCSFSTSFAGELKSLTADIVCGGGNGSPDSPIPIVGHSELNLTRCCVNLWDEEWLKGYYSPYNGNFVPSADYICSKNLIRVLPSTQYYIHSDNNILIEVLEYRTDGTYIRRLSSGSANEIITTDDNCAYIHIGTHASGVITTYTSGISINYPSTDTDYHAYNGQTFTVAFGQTVYGGVLDVTRGKLHVRWSNAIDLGSLGWSYDVVQQVFVTTDLVGYKNGTPFFCDVYTDLGAVAISQITNYGGTLRGAALYIKNTDYTDAPTFKTAMSGKYITAELATPIVIDVPSISVSAENGVNNIISDGGGGVDVEYYTDLAEDIKDFIGDGVEVGDLANVEITTPSNNQVLKYDATSQKWVNGNSSGGSAHNYSTTEQEVGTWIDGSPIYERTVVLTNQATAASLSLLISDTDLLALNIDSANVIGLESIARSVNASPRVEFIDNVYTKGNYESGLTLSFTNGSLYYQCRYSNSAFDFDLYLTFRYTKST